MIDQLADIHSGDSELAESAATELREGFADYNARFRAITQRAQRHFETGNFTAARADAVARIELYDLCVVVTARRLEQLLGMRRTDRELWSRIHNRFADAIAGLLDQELNKTFYNTLTRRFFRTHGVAPDIEFVALDIEPTDRITHPVARHSYAVFGDLARICERALNDFVFAIPYANIAQCSQHIAETLKQRLTAWGADPVRAIEMLETVFYRERRAYLVGRVFGVERVAPLVIALVNGEGGIYADAVLTERDHVAQVFGFARSYFQADLPTVGDAVVFLRTLLPTKPIDELYTVLGRAKQGKTERYRHFFRHLAANAQESFVHAEGERGMVMLVFTLPSYPLVFKLIRDRFAFPKESVRAEVMEKYTLVFRHDRGGRLVDAQEFRWLRFPRTQFAQVLLDELLTSCSETAFIDGDDVVIAHCYVERRMRPLNLYLRECDAQKARQAILDYGQAIRDLACSNVFPGDLLLKNFGVSRHGRVIFYDYDELCLVTECRFRELPEDDDGSGSDKFYVGAHDVFPEQFPRFLGLDQNQREALLATHGEIFSMHWWSSVQEAIRTGRPIEVPAYPEHTRLGAAQQPFIASA
jgi:isocitrate dehydrogenase kinase/phosphatase